jgi:predicted kinase
VKPDELKGSSEKMVSRIEYLLVKRHFHITTSLKNFGEFTVYIMCGLPGSGKSTWANDNFPNLPIVSRDIIREELGMTEVGVKFMGTTEQEDLVSKISAERVNELCRKKQSFIYDNMNSREKYRKSFLESIRKYNPVVRVIYLEVNDLSILESHRPEIAAHDADAGYRVFERMVENMEFPRPYEYDTIDIYQDYSDPTVKHEVEKEIGYIHLQDTKLKYPNDTKQ